MILYPGSFCIAVIKVGVMSAVDGIVTIFVSVPEGTIGNFVNPAKRHVAVSRNCSASAPARY